MNRVVNFHQIKNSKWLESIILYLKSRYSFITAEDLNGYYNYAIPLNNTCHITVDDGDISFYKIIYPVLRKHKVPATLFVSPKICKEECNYWFQEIIAFDMLKVKNVISSVTGTPVSSLSGNRIASILKTMQINTVNEVIAKCRLNHPDTRLPFQNINVKQLREIDRSGLVTLGAHTLNHPILKNETNESSNREITKSIDRLAELIDHEIRYFAYPNGIPMLDFTDREIMYLKKCGIRLSFKNDSDDTWFRDDPMSIPRIAITDNESVNLIKIKLHFARIWDKLKGINPKGEHQERKKLLHILTTSNPGS